jgi:CrcB protein
MAWVTGGVATTRGRPQRRRPGLDRWLAMRLEPARSRVVAVFVGGGIGALGRAALSEAVPRDPGEWPWATFVANLLGTVLLGWLLTRLAERVAPTRHWRPLLGTGVAGALTTFSTFQLETFEFIRDGHVGLAVAYPVASIALGMFLAVASTLLTRRGRHW